VVILLAVQPLMAAANGALWLNDKITRTMVVAAVVAVGGMGVIGWD
jgi:drug/metabolite transporter (DMT)-like permease